MPSVLSDSSVEHRDSTKASSSSGVSSDCSDSDHEIDTIDSKVYDFRIEVSTQTASLEEQKSELTHLTLEIEKLTKFKIEATNNENNKQNRKNPDDVALEELDDLRVRIILFIKSFCFIFRYIL